MSMGYYESLILSLYRSRVEILERWIVISGKSHLHVSVVLLSLFVGLRFTFRFGEKRILDEISFAVQLFVTIYNVVE